MRREAAGPGSRGEYHGARRHRFAVDDDAGHPVPVDDTPFDRAAVPQHGSVIAHPAARAWEQGARVHMALPVEMEPRSSAGRQRRLLFPEFVPAEDTCREPVTMPAE